jgi:tetratricopeptide (TPR) repeat protein
MTRWEAAHLSSIQAIPVPETLEWTPVRRHFGIRAFGVNAYTATESGHEVVERHTEDVRGHEELYVVIAGSASFELDGEKVDAPTGTVVFVRDPSVERYAIAAEPGTTILALGGEPGSAYSPGPWEWVFVARTKLEQEDFEGAIAEIEDGLAVHPGQAALLYWLARSEALAGRSDDALSHLAEAIAEREELRSRAAEDDAFVTIRDDPRFSAAS